MLKKNHVTTILLVLMLLLAARPSYAAKKSESAATTPAPAQQLIQPAAPAAVNSVTQAALNSGVLACVARIDQVANFLTGGNPAAGALLFIPPANPDQRLVSISLEIPATTNVPVAYASTSVAPNQANGCGAMYESVIYWSQGCDTVATRNFGGLKKVGPLSKEITMLDGGIWTKVFLMPAGKGCVSIKKEIVQ